MPRAIDRNFETVEAADEYSEQYYRGLVMAKEIEDKYFEDKYFAALEAKFTEYVKDNVGDFSAEYFELCERYNLHFVSEDGELKVAVLKRSTF